MCVGPRPSKPLDRIFDGRGRPSPDEYGLGGRGARPYIGVAYPGPAGYGGNAGGRGASCLGFVCIAFITS
jgi:hypothetical protein